MAERCEERSVPVCDLFDSRLAMVLGLSGTRLFRIPSATGAGAVAGIATTVLFGAPNIDLVSIVFAATDVLSTSVCWWFISPKSH